MIAVGLYNIFIQLYKAGISLAAFFVPKAKLWIEGRRNWEEKLKIALQKQPQASKQKTIWLHASSTGEFEQGRPIIEKFKSQDPNLSVVVSFFSPSGYMAASKYTLADVITYLPLDTAANARDFIDIIEPDVVIWVKYEYWFNFLNTLHSRKIPVILVAANFLPRQPFTKWYGGLHRKMLGFFNQIFVQDEASKQILHSIGLDSHAGVAGDSRFDRVLEIAGKWHPLPEVETFLHPTKPIIVAGSTWPQDHALILEIIKKGYDFQWVIAPHHVDEKTINGVVKELPGAQPISQLQEKDAIPDILIIDKIGILSKLYKYGKLCYVGGGFATGLHNTLEAAVYGKPVFWGPQYADFKEASALIRAGGGFSVSNAEEWVPHLTKLTNNKSAYEEVCRRSANFVQERAGTTEMVVNYIYKKRLLTR